LSARSGFFMRLLILGETRGKPDGLFRATPHCATQYADSPLGICS
jgi:hypothetical protein